MIKIFTYNFKGLRGAEMSCEKGEPSPRPLIVGRETVPNLKDHQRGLKGEVYGATKKGLLGGFRSFT